MASTASLPSRRGKKRSYQEKSDEQFFEELENDEVQPEDTDDVDLKQRGLAYDRKQAGSIVHLSVHDS